MTRRLLFTYLTFALLILVSLEVPLGYVYHRSEMQQAFGQLEHDAEVLAAFVDTAMRNGQPAQVDLLAHESAQRLGGHVDVVDAQGVLLTSTLGDQLRPVSLAEAPDIRAVLGGDGRISTGTGQHGDVDVMSVAVPVHPGVAAQRAIRVSVPTEPITSRIHRFWTILAIAGTVVLFAVALVAFALARWISRPVRALERATRRLADGTPLPQVSTTTGPPELRSLATTFHITATRVQALIESQRSFIGHASHQLKTPLAALRLRLENLEPHLTPKGATNLQAALTETDRLAQMVETLLAMARSEQTKLPREHVALNSAVAERIGHWSPLAAQHGARLIAAGPDDAQVWTIPGAVDQILDNLIANALRAAPAHSTVTVTWRLGADPGRDAPTVELHVIDEGPGLTEEQRTRALDPFWRAPDAAKGGTGLGLSLVHKLAQAGGGSAQLRPAESHGIDAVVTFPTAQTTMVPTQPV